MSEKPSNEQLREWTEPRFQDDLRAMATELLGLRAAWKIAEPHLPPPVYRRALATLSTE